MVSCRFIEKKASVAICLTALGLLAFAFVWTPYRHPRFDRRNSSAYRLSSVNTPPTVERLSTTSIAFEPNLGQFDRHVKFASRANGYNLFLTSNQAVVVVGRSPGTRPNRGTPSLQAAELGPAGIVHMSFVGASAGARVEGERKLSGKTNYFVGDPRNWRSNVPQYGRVVYRGIYSGTDLVFYGNPQRLEMDFRVAPRARPQDILLGFQSHHALRVSASGDLVVEDSGQPFILGKPRAYQEVHGTERDVAVNYRLTPARQVGFNLGNYDSALPLVIDPVVTFSTFLGGSGTDLIGAVAVDSAGSPYVFGTTTSPNFPTTNVLQSSGIFFLTKLNLQGAAIVYSTLFGGGGLPVDQSRLEKSAGIAIDSLGNAYVAGTTDSSSYPTTTNSFQKTLKGGADAFVTKFSPDGSAIIYSTFVGGSGNDIVAGVALDPLGEVIIAGQTVSNDFPTVAALQSALKGSSDAFVAKINASGSALVYSTYLGGSSSDQANGVATDSSGNAFVGGATSSTDFPLSANAFSSTANGGFITELNAVGALSYSTFFPVSEVDSIALDSLGNFYVAGKFPGANFPQINPVVSCTSGVNCPFQFLSKFNASGSMLIYSTTWGDPSAAGSRVTVGSMALDSAGNVYITGSAGTDGSGSIPLLNPLSSNGSFYLIAFAPSGNSLLYSTWVPASARICWGCNTFLTGPVSVALDASFNAYVGGATSSLPLVSPLQPAFGGGPQNNNALFTDGFLMKIENISAPAVGLPGTLSLPGVTPVGMSSTAQVQIADLGSANLIVTSIQSSGDFTETDNCVGTVNAASGCSITIAFTPSAAGTRSGAITITDNAAGSPHSFALIGVGGVPQVNLMPSSLTFVTQSPGTTSSTQPVQVNNTGQADLVISRIDVSTSFQETNDCPPALAAGSSCTVSVAFAPSASASGTVSGTLTITDNASGSPHTVSLAGTAGTPTLGLATSGSSSQTVQAGNAATYTVSIGGNGLGGAANLSCTGAPTGATCTAPLTVSVSAATASTFTVGVTTTSRTLSALQLIEDSPASWVCAVLFLGISICRRTRRKKRVLLGLAWLIPLAVSLCSCGGGSSSSNPNGTPAGTYSLTVAATSGSASESVQLTLIVQ